MIETLRQTNNELYSYVKDEIVDLAVSTYISYWQDVLSDTPLCDVGDDDSGESSLGLYPVDPLAMAAYLGDLHGLGYLSIEMFSTCITFMVNNIGSLCYLHSVEVIIERAYSYCVSCPELLFECLDSIRRRARRFCGTDISFEEDVLAPLLYRLLSRMHNTTGNCDRWDPGLSADEAGVLNLFPVPDPDNKVHDYPWSAPTYPLKMTLIPLHSAITVVNGSYPTYEDLVESWQVMYNSPDPEDLLPPPGSI
ncbi:hypothetical protein BYT27DRAFT_7147070 [Phlegmacium glaucopus]|nr:hypothetical protein BYT27DRAFT_7147070 [Phlegmacium glaucopus]